MSGKLSAIVAGSLAGVLLLCVAAIAVLAGLDKATPGVLENLAAGALGALAALLARVGGDTQSVEVVNSASQPVPVTDDRGDIPVVEALLIVVLLLIVLAIFGLL